MKRIVKLQLTQAEAKALAEACAFREAGDTSDLTQKQFDALTRAFSKLQEARDMAEIKNKVSGGGADEVKPSNCVGEHGSVMIPPECNHEWVEEYYGFKCSKCNQFHAHGCEPWAPID